MRDALPSSGSDISPANDAASLTALEAELREAVAPGIQVLGVLGGGGMGVVFLGRDPLLKRQVAIKVLAPALASDTTAHARFVREAEAAAAVAHPHVVAIHLVGQLPRSGAPYFVMQFIEGRTLADELTGGAALPEMRATRILGEVASALTAAHAHGLVHRDVKPSNIMLETETDRAVVLDFGISAVLQTRAHEPNEKLTQHGMYVGTPAYMSPEQAAGEEVSGSSDVYALGIVAFEMLAGRAPFSGSPIALMAAHLKDTAPSVHTSRPEIDPHVAELVDRCLKKDPSLRPSASDVAQALLPAAGTLIEWPPPGLEAMRGQGARFLRRGTVGCLLGVIFFLLLGTQPTMDAPRWANGEQSLFWAAILRPGQSLVFGGLKPQTIGGTGRFAVGYAPADSTSIWLSLLGFSAIGVLAVACALARPAWRLGRQAGAARRAGYPWRVIADVAWDHDADTAALVNGTGRFALLGPGDRTHLLRLRRLQGLVLVISGVSAVLLPALWLGGAIGGWERASALLPSGELLALLLPLAGGAAFLLLARRERSLRRPATAMHRRDPGSVGVRRELVDAWLHSASGDTAPPSTGTRTARRATVFSLVASLPLLLLGATCLITAMIAALAAGRLRVSRGAAAAWIAAQHAPGEDSMLVSAGVGLASLPPLTWQELDSLDAGLALPASGAEPDLADARLLLARGNPTRTGAPVFDADWARAASLDQVQAAMDNGLGFEDYYRILAAYSAYTSAKDRRPMDDTTFQRLSIVARTPWLDVWRRLARSAPLPPLWKYRPGSLQGLPSPFAIPLLPVGAFKDLAYRNSVAGYVALRSGDRATATLRGRENLSVGHLLSAGGSDLLDVLAGQVIIAIGRDLIGTVAKQSHDDATLRQLVSIRNAYVRWRSEQLSAFGWAALFADPANPAGLPFLGRNSLGPPQRISALIGVTFGFCLDAREILFGVDGRRRELLRRADLRGVPGANEMIALHERWLTRVAGDSADAFPPITFGEAPEPGIRTPPMLRPLGWVGLRGVRDRITFCQRFAELM